MPKPTTVCPTCGSEHWVCFNEATRNCWNADGTRRFIVVIGGLKCVDCEQVWLDYTPKVPDDCECEEY